MRKDVLKDTRLLESLEHIDDEYISSAARYKMKRAQNSAPSAKGKLRSLKYVLALAACLVLMSAVMPVVGYVLKEIGVIPGGTPVGETTESETTEEITDEETEENPEELEIEIPEYIPPEPMDEPFYWHFFGKQSEDEEAFTREEMLDIRRAYACYVFKNKYISVYKETMELWNSPDRAKERAFDQAKAEADSAASRFFRNNHIAERCYGWMSDRVILALLGKVDGETVFKVADNEMEFPCGTEMFVYEKGEVFDFVEYRDRGGFTFDEELEIAVKHWIYEGAIETVVNNVLKDVTYTKPTEDYDLESYFGAEFINNEYIEPIAVLTKIDDCLVVHGKMGIGTLHLTYQVGAYKFDYPADFDLYVGYNGDSYDVSTAYKQGILDDFDVAKIYELYLDYCETDYQVYLKRLQIDQFLQEAFGVTYDDGFAKLELFASVDECMVAGMKTGWTVANTYNVGGYEFYFPSDTDIRVLYNSEVYDFMEAYTEGILTDADMAVLYEVYLQFYEARYGKNR